MRRLSEEDFKLAIQKRALVTSDTTRIINTTSGTPRVSRWLFDFRAISLDPLWLNTYAEIFWERFAAQHPFQIGGLETASLPLITAIVMKGVERGTPVNGFFIRKSSTPLSIQEYIVGTLTKDSVILVDDLINSGGSFKRQIDILHAANLHVTDIYTIVAFREDAAYAHLHDLKARVTYEYSLPDFGIAREKNNPAQEHKENMVMQWSFANSSHRRSRTDIDAHIPAPAIGAEHVYTALDSNRLSALSIETGEISWTYEVQSRDPEAAFSEPLIYKQSIIVGAPDKRLHALDITTGHPLWKTRFGRWHRSALASCTKSGLVYAVLSTGFFKTSYALVAFDAESGSRRWSRALSASSRAAPLIIEKKSLVIVADDRGVVSAFALHDGAPLWATSLPRARALCARYDAHRARVLASFEDGALHSLSIKDGTIHWVHTNKSGTYAPPRIQGDVLYGGYVDKNLFCLDVASGEVRWEYETFGRIVSTPCIAENSLWVGSNDGRLYEIEPSSGKKLSTHQFPERIAGSILYSAEHSTFFILTSDRTMYCTKRAPKNQVAT